MQQLEVSDRRGDGGSLPNANSMSAKEKADTLIKIADHAASRHDRRRDTEWKMSFALWTLLLAPYWLNRKIDISLGLEPWKIAAAAGMVTVLYLILWIAPLWAANKSNKDLAEQSCRAAYGLCSADYKAVPVFPPKTERSLKSLDDWAMLTHLIVTFFLAAAFFIAFQ